MNFYWRQTIVGLLRHAGEEVPALAERCARVSSELDRTLTSPWLEEAFSLFQDATLSSHDPVFVTGAYYTMRALNEVHRWEERAGGPVRLVDTPTGADYSLPGRPEAIVEPVEDQPRLRVDPAMAHAHNDHVDGEHVDGEVDRGIMELFDRIRQGATLEEALALFPQLGDEHSPE